MKRLITCLALAAILLSGCTVTPSDGGATGTLPDDTQISLARDGAPVYTVIRGDTCASYETDAAVNIKKALTEFTGCSFTIETDWSREETLPDRYEILIGSTNRPESVAALEGLPEESGTIIVTGKYLVINADGEAAMKKTVDMFIENLLTGEDKNVVLDARLPLTYIPNRRAEYVDEPFDVTVTDKYYGGAQYITKLFTEGLGRSPEAAEYKHYSDIILKKGCVQSTLADMAFEFFFSDSFKALNLSPRETAFAVYRAVLNRDPTESEASKGITSAADTAKQLALSTELKGMVTKMNRGSYGWGVNNKSAFTGSDVLTSADVNRMLEENDRVELPQGCLVLCTEGIKIKQGQTLTTEGTPTCYLNMARLLRIEAGSWAIVEMTESNGTVSNVWMDGNRTAVGICEGINCFLCSVNGRVIGCKMSDTAASSNMATVCTISGVYVAHNLITCYTSSNLSGWTDGITHQARGIVEYNTIIDATDVAIVVFRDWTETPQDSIIRYNRIISAGNSAFGALHTDAWVGEGERSFEGCAFISNEVWSSMKTHFNVCLSAASTAWHFNGNEARGAAFYNNYTPEGMTAVCGVAIVSDSMKDVVMRGNQLHVYIANIESDLFGTHLIAFNDRDYDGDVQKPYTDTPVHNDTTSFIGQRINDGAAKWTYREGIIYEDFSIVPDRYNRVSPNN